MNKNVIGTMAGLVLLIMSASVVEVWAFDEPAGRGGRIGPPPEAIEACKDKSEGAKVELTSPRGEKIKASCEQIDGQLAAVPEESFRFRGPKAQPDESNKE
jgi:hypothetical protein